MQKSLFVDFEKCTGCRSCEVACSVKLEGMCNPEVSRIRVMKWADRGLDVPMVCNQCESPPCQDICPRDATFRETRTGAMVIDYDKCIGCRACMLVCPFGAISFDPVHMKVIKCNLCQGDPHCVRFCETGAVRYIALNKVDYLKRKLGAEKLSELLSQRP